MRPRLTPRMRLFVLPGVWRGGVQDGAVAAHGQDDVCLAAGTLWPAGPQTPIVRTLDCSSPALHRTCGTRTAGTPQRFCAARSSRGIRHFLFVGFGDDHNGHTALTSCQWIRPARTGLTATACYRPLIGQAAGLLRILLHMHQVLDVALRSLDGTEKSRPHTAENPFGGGVAGRRCAMHFAVGSRRRARRRSCQPFSRPGLKLRLDQADTHPRPAVVMAGSDRENMLASEIKETSTLKNATGSCGMFRGHMADVGALHIHDPLVGSAGVQASWP